MTPQQREEMQAWRAELVASFYARRCYHRGCKRPVFMIVIGSEEERAPGGILIKRKAVDRNYCRRHAPGLPIGAEAASA